MEHLNKFIKKYNYILSDKLIYNSYGVEGLRDEYRPGESISVSEILGLIIDPGFEFVKEYNSEALKESCEYGTKTHGELEEYTKGKKLLDRDNKLHRQFKLACIKEDIVVRKEETMFELQIEGLPVITGTLDVIGDIEVIEHIVDYKTGKSTRNFKSRKNSIQLSFYRMLSGIDNSALLYLNQKGYSLEVSDNKEYYDLIVGDLIEYTKQLFKEGKVHNLAIK